MAHLRRVQVGPDIVTYLEKIDATLEPYGGRFIVHGESAAAWYASHAYQEILPLRHRNAEGWAVVVDGVPDGHVATDILRS